MFPTSYGQQRMWFLDQLVPGNSFYNIHLAVPLPFAVDSELLRQSIDEVVWRHDTLRTTFELRDGEVVQVVVDQRPHELTCWDLSPLSAGEREETAAKLATEQAGSPFDLRTGPLLRTALVRLAPAESFLLLTFHHIVADAWSVAVFVRELAVIYEAFARGEETPLPHLTIQYSDFAVWQRSQLDPGAVDRLVDWWREALAGMAALDLPTDSPRPRVPSFKGRTHLLRIPGAVLERARTLAEKERSTEFMLLLAGFALLLHRYTGQDDLAVGVPVAGRPHPELEPLIGFFVNTLVLRIDASGDPTFRELLGRVRRTTLEALAHQDLPFEKLVEVLHPERDLSRNPLFQVSFQLHNEPGSEATGAPGAAPEAASRSSVFDLAFDFWRTPDGLTARIDYATDLFRPATIARLGRHYLAILRVAVADPDQRIGAASLGEPAEDAAVAARWNRTDRPLAPPLDIAGRLRAIAGRHPKVVAVADRKQWITYEELLLRGGRLAAALQTRGVQPGVPVGISMDRSVERVVALVGIVLAGGCYMALDVDAPPARLAAMMTQAGVCLVLADSHRPLPPCCLPPGVAVHASGALEAETQPTDAGVVGPSADDALYVGFTSGTTGAPKGVAVLHRAVVNLVDAADFAGLGPGKRMLQLAPLAFDATTIEIWFSLLTGATLVVQPPGPVSLDEIADFMDQTAVSHAFLTAGLMHQIVDARPASVARLEVLLTGGDVVSPAHVERVLAAPMRPRVVNLYGPTEATVFATACVLDRPEDVTYPLPIGRPIANVRVHVLDMAGQAVPVGVPGELYIGGLGVAPGYLGMPEETSVAFVPDPDRADGRLYRTGDRARLRGDGHLEFLGRVDRQVKIRGFRVEPLAVELALRRHPAVREAVVSTILDAAGSRTLAAWIVPEPGAAMTIEELKHHLGDQLPDYMHPTGMRVLETLPLRANGKIDLAALPPPAMRSRVYTAPRSEAEQAVVPIWEELLGVSPVGVDDDFFGDLGGHSLLGTLLVARMRDAFGVELPLRALFEHRTPARLARLVEECLISEIEGAGEEQLVAAKVPEPDGTTPL